MLTLPPPLLRSLAAIVGQPHVLTGGATAGFAVDWTGRFQGHTPAVVRPRDTAEVAAVLALCTDAGVAVVPQGGNTGLVGGGVPRHGEVVLSLTRLNRMGPVDQAAAQVTAGAGVTLEQVAEADPTLDLAIAIASRGSASVGGAVATNAGGLRVLRFGPMRAQLRGIEAVLADGTVVSHLAGLVKDNTGYDYPSLLCGSEGTLAVVTQARLRLIPRLRDTVTVLIGLGGLRELHELTGQAVREVPGLVSAEFFTPAGLDILVLQAGLAPPLPRTAPAYLLLEAAGPGALDDLAGVIGDHDAVAGESAADRGRLWSYRERQPDAAGFLGPPIKLDVSVPAAHWVRLASEVAGVVSEVDEGARVITFGHVADGNVHVNIVPAQAADGRHEDAVFGFVASLGGSISAEHGIGALKAPWLHLARSPAERRLFTRIRSALDPYGTLNPNVLPRLPRGNGRFCRYATGWRWRAATGHVLPDDAQMRRRDRRPAALCAADREQVLSAAASRPAGAAALVQAIYADDYRGAEVTFCGEISGDLLGAQAGLRLEILRSRWPEAGVREDHGATIAGRRGDWTGHAITARIPADADLIRFGIALNGPGRIALRRPDLSVAGPESGTP